MSPSLPCCLAPAAVISQLGTCPADTEGAVWSKSAVHIQRMRCGFMLSLMQIRGFSPARTPNVTWKMTAEKLMVIASNLHVKVC